MSARLARAWAWLSGLSLDVSLGALGLSALVCEACAVMPPKPELIALWAAVSLMYTLDHQLDLSGERRSPQNARRAFHQQARYTLERVSVLSAALGALMLPLLQRSTLWVGGALTLSCALYVWGAQRDQRPLSALKKKTCVAFVYPLGVISPAVAGASIEPSAGRLIPVASSLTLMGLSLLSLTIANLGLFELAERRASGRAVRSKHEWGTLLCVLCLAPALMLCTPLRGWGTQGAPLPAALFILSLIGGAHLWIYLNLDQFLGEERYRRLADGSFLLSWLTLLL